MTIKKLKTVSAAPKPAGTGDASAVSGDVPEMPTETASPAKMAGAATIADRFKLDAPVAKEGPTVGKKAASIALAAGVVALVVAGVLTFILWKHWEFLMPA